MFSALLGLASAGVGLIGAGYNYSLGMQQLALQRQALRDQKDMAMLNYGMGRDQMRREREQEAYLRSFNEQNQRLAQEEYYARLGQFEQRKQQAMQERQYAIERQVMMDREAARRQQFMLEQFLNNQNIAAEERQFAIQQLEEAKAIAAGERDEDLRKRAEEQEMAAIERDFAIEEFRRAQTTAAQERQEDFTFRQDILGRLDAMSSEITGALGEMPDLTAPELLGRDDFESILSRFDANAVANVDRAVDRVASQNEANLMTRGLQHSSIGQSARSDIARRMALEYENARQAAMESALRYISGSNDIVLQDYNALKDARGTRMAEIQAILSPAIEGMMNMRQLSSANDFQAPIPISSAIVQRGVSSANDWQAPLQVGSSIFDRTDIGVGHGDTLLPQSIADAFLFDAGTRQYQPQMWNITSPAGFYSNAMSGMSSIAGHYNAAPYIQGGNSFLSGAMSDLGFAAGEFQHSRASSPQSPVGYRPPATSGLPMYAPLPTPRPNQSYAWTGRIY